MEIWRVNVNTQTVSREPVPVHWDDLGGRGLLAQIMVDEVPGKCDPLGSHNKLVFAPGLLVGHMLSSCDRISVGGKSPLTGGIKESNAGGSTGLKMTHLGIKALIIEGQPRQPGWQVLHLSAGGARFDPADDLAGLGVYDCTPGLLERYGENVAVALIGPGGEMQLAAAGIQNLDKDRVPSRINARGGMGAVMGSKGLKAIVVDSSRGSKPPIAHLAEFRSAQKVYNQALLNHPQTAVYRDFGTASLVMMCNALGCLPTRNFSSGRFEQAEAISGEVMRETILQRGGVGDPAHACMAGCVIRCSNIYPTVDGKTMVSPLEYETLGLMGSNLGMTGLDIVARMNYVVNDLGLDSIDVGAALGVAAEAGLWCYGDGARALALLEEIRASTPLGRMLGSGAAVTGRVLGVRRVPVVKGQAISAYDPRAIKGTGVTYATSPQGADHTAGLTVRAKVDHTKPEGQADLSRTAQVNNAGWDTVGACLFAAFGFNAAPGVVRDLLNARYSWQAGEDILQVLGRRTISLEREFNRRAGFTTADDRLPEWMTEEPLSPHNTVFDVPEQDLDNIYNW